MKTIRAFNYYGSKVQAAKHYTPPRYSRIVEPFAGGAGYSLAYRDREVVLVDRNPNVIDAWLYLINTRPEDIVRLPLLAPGESIPEHLSHGAQLLIGWSVMLYGVRPQSKLVGCSARVPSSFWGESKREALASLSAEIKHWRAFCLSYDQLPNTEATWFIDPPYIGKEGAHYPFGNNVIDYQHLGSWCRARAGQVIVCEAPGATWLPFKWSHEHASAPTADVAGRRRAKEMVYEQ